MTTATTSAFRILSATTDAFRQRLYYLHDSNDFHNFQHQNHDSHSHSKEDLSTISRQPNHGRMIAAPKIATTKYTTQTTSTAASATVTTTQPLAQHRQRLRPPAQHSTNAMTAPSPHAHTHTQTLQRAQRMRQSALHISLSAPHHTNHDHATYR